MAYPLVSAYVDYVVLRGKAFDVARADILRASSMLLRHHAGIVHIDRHDLMAWDRSCTLSVRYL